MKLEEIIKKYEKKKADNFKMIDSAKGDDAELNILWLFRINELFDGFIEDVKKLNEETRKDFEILKCGNSKECDRKLNGFCSLNAGECNLQE